MLQFDLLYHGHFLHCRLFLNLLKINVFYNGTKPKAWLVVNLICNNIVLGLRWWMSKKAVSHYIDYNYIIIVKNFKWWLEKKGSEIQKRNREFRY